LPSASTFRANREDKFMCLISYKISQQSVKPPDKAAKVQFLKPKYVFIKQPSRNFFWLCLIKHSTGMPGCPPAPTQPRYPHVLSCSIEHPFLSLFSLSLSLYLSPSLSFICALMRCSTPHRFRDSPSLAVLWQIVQSCLITL
jgi:hypothetical protein